MKRIRPARWCTAPRALPRSPYSTTTTTTTTTTTPDTLEPAAGLPARNPLPSPPPSRALSSAKLAALHARLSLSRRIPLQTLARTLITSTADAHPQYNNAHMATVGRTLINYHVAEHLMTSYPRLPMQIVFEAMHALAGPTSLLRVAQQWGVDAAAFPGEEVDPGLLQWVDDARLDPPVRELGYMRKDHYWLEKPMYRRGSMSRIVLDDPFGEVVLPLKARLEREVLPSGLTPGDEYRFERQRQVDRMADAHASFVSAVVAAISIHVGRDAAAAFIKSHVLARKVHLESLFSFSQPVMELAKLCAREGFEAPVARLLSETGRASRAPVFVVGIYSGRDKLGEGAAPSLEMGRNKAAMAALKAWYLYSPGAGARVPSDMLVEGAAPWKPAHIDMGEIV